MRGDVTELLQQLYYGHQCHIGCTHDIITLADDGIDDILKDFALALHSGELGGNGIHAGLYSETARKLTEAITKGMGKVSFGFDDPNNALRAQLLANVHAFSGAKSLTENAVFSELMFDEHGDLKPFKQFLNDVKNINQQYNKDYLSAEYNNAVAGSQTAILWNQYNDDDWLEYSTAGDERVRASHAAIDHVVQQKSSAFWQNNWPPNGWNCRCTVIPGNKPAQPMPETEAQKLGTAAAVEPQFKMNSGSDAIVFKDDHPYFTQSGKMNELDAVKNYGLKSVNKLLAADDLPAIKTLTTQTDYYAWWDKMLQRSPAGSGGFTVTDKTGVTILFDAPLKAKTASEYGFASTAAEILIKPDEIWKTNKGWSYISYFTDGMYAVLINDVNGTMAATDIIKSDKSLYSKLRRGVLIK